MNTDPPEAPESGAGTIEKAVDVLFHLHEAAAPLGVTAIGRALGMPKSSVHRLLQSLARRELVERDSRGRYRPGVGLVALGLGVIEREPVVRAARPVLEAEVDAIGETLFVVGARAGRLVVLDKVEGPGFLRAAPRVGAEVPVHATAVGKLYLAHASEAVAEYDVAAAFTRNTITDKERLDRAVHDVREAGFASNLDEWIEGLSVVAAPIFYGERLVGALALAAPSARLADLGAREVSRRIMAAAAKVGMRLEGQARDGTEGLV